MLNLSEMLPPSTSSSPSVIQVGDANLPFRGLLYPSTIPLVSAVLLLECGDLCDPLNVYLLCY